MKIDIVRFNPNKPVGANPHQGGGFGPRAEWCVAPEDVALCHLFSVNAFAWQKAI